LCCLIIRVGIPDPVENGEVLPVFAAVANQSRLEIMCRLRPGQSTPRGRSRTGKSSRAVPEQFVFLSIRRDCSAMDRHKGAMRTCSQVMDRPRTHFLTRTGFPKIRTLALHWASLETLLIGVYEGGLRPRNSFNPRFFSNCNLNCFGWVDDHRKIRGNASANFSGLRKKFAAPEAFLSSRGFRQRKAIFQ
jgi:hypothetical protein